MTLQIVKPRLGLRRVTLQHSFGRQPMAATSMVLLMLSFAVALAAGVTGSISGTVKDSSGGVIAGAKITARNLKTGITQVTTADSQGAYNLLSLVPGSYEIEVQQSGFKDYRQTGLLVDVNSALRVDVVLQVGEVAETVEVNSSAVQVETQSTQLGEVIGSNKMTSIPLNGRSYTDLLALQPGVVPVSSGQYTPASPSGNLDAGSVSVSGGRESANGFMVNGGNVEEGTNNGAAIIPNLDSIAEFRILTNNFDAEYGNYSGGQINAITKSGTNEYHGDLFEFLRNTDLDARNFFSPIRGVLHQNQFGGTLGGPIVHRKVFFFIDYQGTRLVVGKDTGLVAVPSAANRAGDLSSIASQLTGSVNGSSWANQLSQELRYPVSQGEAYFTSGCVSSAACVFPNAIIPAAAISAPARALLKYIPKANLAGGGFSTSAFSQRLRDDKGSFRVDANSRWGMLSAYYFFDDYNLNDPYPPNGVGATVPGFAAVTTGRAQLLNLADTQTLSGGSAVNEFRFSYLRDANFFTKPIGGVGPSLSSLGFAEGPSTLGIVPVAPNFEGVPPITFNAFSIGEPNQWSQQFNNTFQWLDNYSKVLGKHTIKFGGNFHFDEITVHDAGANNGNFFFTGSETGNDFADFLIGAPSSYQQGEQLPLHSRSRYLGLYAQDSWRFRPSLTVNYGLRWEFSMPWYEGHNELEAFVPGLQSKIFPGAPRGWVFPRDPGIPSTIAPTRYRNFAPRIGLAYSPNASEGFWHRILGAGNTSIRAGYGIFYTSIEELTNALVVGDPPFGLFYVSPAQPQFSNPFADRGDGVSQGQRYPVAFPPANIGPKNPDNSVDWSQFEPISSSPTYLRTNGLPSTQEFELSLQRQLASTTVLSVNYVGALGRHLLVDLESNPANATLCLSLSQPSALASGVTPCGPFGEDSSYTTASGTVINGTRPFSPNFGSNGWYVNTGTSSYNALQLSVRHVSGRLEFLAGYTYSKSLDNSSGLGEQVNPFNPRISRSLSSSDLTHNFVVSYQYQLPLERIFGRGRLGSGWAISGITRFATGLPVTLLEPDDNSLLGTSSTGPNSNTIDEPVYTAGPLNITDARSRRPYFNISLFSVEPIGKLGNAPRRFFHGPGINNWDIALLKDLHLTESKYFQFRFEFFNVFNHAQFDTPDGNINDTGLAPGTGFGFVTSAREPRIGQVALKFIF